jgi:hypothetical protein
MNVYRLILAVIFGVLRAPALVYTVLTGVIIYLITMLFRGLMILPFKLAANAGNTSYPVLMVAFILMLPMHFEDFKKKHLEPLAENSPFFVLATPFYQFGAPIGMFGLLELPEETTYNGLIESVQEYSLFRSQKGSLTYEPRKLFPYYRIHADWTDKQRELLVENGAIKYLFWGWLFFLATPLGAWWASVVRAIFVYLRL